METKEIRVDTVAKKDAAVVWEECRLKFFRLYFCRDQFGGRAWLVLKRSNSFFVGMVLESEAAHGDKRDF